MVWKSLIIFHCFCGPIASPMNKPVGMLVGGSGVVICNVLIGRTCVGLFLPLAKLCAAIVYLALPAVLRTVFCCCMLLVWPVLLNAGRAMCRCFCWPLQLNAGCAVCCCACMLLHAA